MNNTRYIFSVLVLRSKASQLVWRGLLFGALFVFGSFSLAAPARADYYAQGIVKSTNMLSGATNVTAIASVTVTATLPTNTTAKIKYSQDNVNFYNAAGTQEGYDTVAAGTNVIDISALAWTNSIFYYKIELATTDSVATPVISDVQVNYTGDAAAAPNCSSGCYTTGTIVSTDLMSGVERPMRGTEYFAYEISALPGGSSVTAQFSQDGTNWYDASGTLWGATTLASGDHMEYATALSLATLNWESGTSFYYKLNLSTTDSTQVPVVASAGLLFAQITIISGAQNTTNVNGLVGLWSFDGQGTTWTSSTTGTTADSSVNSHTGTLTNMSQTGSIAPGQIGQAFDFDGTDDYVSVADNAALDVGDTADFSLSGWFYRDTFTTDDTLIAKRSGIVATDIGYIVYIDDATDKLVFEVSDGTDEYSLTSTSAFTATGWNHYAIVWDQDSALGTEVYVNGVANGATDSGTIGNIGDLGNAVVLALGAESDAGNPFDGKIDETRLYNRALVATEIESLYKFGQSDEVNTGASQAQGTGRLDSGLAGYWKLDDGSGTSATDSSTNANTGTLTNGPTWTTGQIGGAVTFDGTDDRVVTTHTTNLNTYPITVSTWVKTSVNDATRRPIVSKYSFLNGYALYMRGGKVLAWYMGNGSNYIYTGAEGIISTTTVSDDAWHNVVFTVDIVGGKLYVDGKLEASRAWTGTPQASTTTNGLGLSYPDGGSFTAYLAASIDDTRIYNRALSADEVAQLYRLNAPTGTDTSLKGYWSFNGRDMNGTSAYDRSGAGNTGTLTLGPTVTPGKLGQALSFDGTDDYVNLGIPSSINSLQVPMTLSGWFKQTSASPTFQTVIGQFLNTTGHRLPKMVRIDSGVLKYYTSTAAGGFQAFGTMTPSLNTWHFFAVTVSGSIASPTVTITLDGTSESSSLSSLSSSPDTTVPTYIGSSIQDSSQVFRGFIDEVRVYNRALSAAEITALYNTSR